MLKTVIFIVVITQAWAMPDLGRSIKRLTREAASDFSDGCQTAVQCGETFTAHFHDNSSTAEQDCGFFSDYIACLDSLGGLCPAVSQSATDMLWFGKYYLCDSGTTSKACSVAFPCATDFLTLYTWDFGQVESDYCSNARTYKNCLTTYDDSCPLIKEYSIMSDANWRLSFC